MAIKLANEDPDSVRRKPCPQCGNPPPHEWVAWGVYLDKDLNCKKCGYTIDIWNC